VKRAKVIALAELCQKLEDETGKSHTTAQVSKKISNLKQYMKNKTDTNLTGNKKIKLKDWEKEFLVLLGADTNPVFSKVPGNHIYY